VCSMSNNTQKENQPESFYSKLGIPLASVKGAKNAIEANRYTGNAVCLVGDAGIGKSQLVRQIAADRTPTKPFHWDGQDWKESLPIKTLYLAHFQAEDMGVPYPSRAKRNELLQECQLFLNLATHAKERGDQPQYAKYVSYVNDLSSRIIGMGSPLEDGTFEFLVERSLKDMPQEGILFLDEWNRAEKSTIKAFFTLLEDRRVHGVQLVPDGIQIVAAMNPSNAAYSVNEAEKDHAFRRRLIFVALTVNVGAWLNYAENKFHPLVVDFVKAMPDALYDMRLRDAGKAFPCPATWEKVSLLLQRNEELNMDLNSEGVYLSVCGIIGESQGSEFVQYVKNNDIVIAPMDLLKNYNEKSKLRAKVKRLVKEARFDVIKKLCSGVGILLFAHKIDPDSIRMQLGLFMGDLPSEMALAMIEEDFGRAAADTEGGDAYLTQLSKTMVSQPAYQGLFKTIGSALKKMDAAAKGRTPKDPLAP